MAKPKSSRKNPKRLKKTVKTKSTAKSVLCEHCGSKFSKTANLNAHIEKKHKGLRWICPVCGDQQVSKHSHIRHYETMHPNEPSVNADANARYIGSFIEYPEKTKDFVIKDLRDKNEVLTTMVKDFRKRLLTKLKEIINLKAKSGLDAATEKNEFNSLNGGAESQSDDSEISDQEEMADNFEINSDDDDENSEDTEGTDNTQREDPLNHIAESDAGASSSGL